MLRKLELICISAYAAVIGLSMCLRCRSGTINSMKSIVVAYDKNRGIGADNDLLWQRDLPADLKHFKELTVGKTIIMGRNTFDSIGRALPNRQNVVVTHRPFQADGVEAAASLPEAYRLARYEPCIIGGGSIYLQALKDIDTVFATEVDAQFPQATVFFPPLDGAWRETAREHHEADERNKYAFDFVTYRRS